jgi:hypothetical protein
MYGDRVVMIEVAAFMMTIGFFASAETGATASAFHLISRDDFLREALGDVGRGPRRVLHHDLDLPAAEDVAVLLEIRLHAAEDLRAVVGEGARKFRDHADLHRRLRQSCAGGQAQNHRQCGERPPEQILHRLPSIRRTSLRATTPAPSVPDDRNS